MIKRILLVTALAAGTCPAADGVVRRLVWQCETSDPVARNWSVAYGETFDMECRFLDHAAPMDLTGASVVLHCRTNGMAEGWSFQATGSVMSAAGWAKVRVEVDRVLPQGLASASYVLAATAGGTTNLLAASGTLRLSGTGAAVGSPAVPQDMAADLYAAVSNALAVARAAGDSYTMLDSADTNLFLRMEFGTNWVYRLSGAETSRVGRAVLNGELDALALRVDGVTIPSNTVGWIMWDSGSNEWLRVTATNHLLFFDRSDYQPGAPLVTTNGLATPADLYAAVSSATNGLALVSYVDAATNGLIGAAATNGLARLADVQSATQGLARVSVTNGLLGASALAAYTPTASLHALTSGLASAAWTTGLIGAATSGLATAAGLYAATNGLARMVDVQSATQGLARVSVTNGLLGASALAAYTPTASLHALTSGLASAAWTTGLIGAATSGLATAAGLYAATNGLARLADVQSATQGMAKVSVTNGLAAAAWVLEEIARSSNGLVTAGITNGLASMAYVTGATNGLVTASVTNGLVTASITNGLASAAYAASLTNGFVTASVTNGLVTASITNWLASRTYAASLTNGLARLADVQSATQGLATAASVVSATTGVLKAESDTLATVSARGGFAGTETIGPLRVAAQIYGGADTAHNAAGTGWMAFGGGYETSGDYWTALGWHSGDYAAGYYSLYLGAWAGRNSIGSGQIHIGAYLSDPGADHDPINDAFVYDAVTRKTYLGVTNGTVSVRGTFSLLNISATNAVITNLSAQAFSLGGEARTNWPSFDYSITNGLATSAALSAATNGLVGASALAAATNGLVTAGITNGLASVAFVTSQGFVTAAVTNGLGSGGVGASVTNGLASTNYVNDTVALMQAITPGQVTNLVNGLVAGAVGITPEVMTNATSHLIQSFADASGFTTQQIWRAGGGTVTNFFSRAGATGGTDSVYVDGFLRPAKWPVAAGYTVESWRAGESNVLKMVVMADEWEGVVIDTAGVSYSVDWNGDGVADNSWSDNTLATNVYAPADIGKLFAVTIAVTGSASIVSAKFGVDSDAKFPNLYTAIPGAKQNGPLELITPLGMNMTAYALYGTKRLFSLSMPGADTVPASLCTGCSSLLHVSCPDIKTIGGSAFQNCSKLESFTATNLTAIASASAFENCLSMRSFTAPKLGSIGVAAFINCWSLTDFSPLPLWTSVADNTFSQSNLSAQTITNLLAALPYRADLKTISFSYTPGAAEARKWYGTGEGSPSNTLIGLNWKATF